MLLMVSSKHMLWKEWIFVKPPQYAVELKFINQLLETLTQPRMKMSQLVKVSELLSIMLLLEVPTQLNLMRCMLLVIVPISVKVLMNRLILLQDIGEQMFKNWTRLKKNMTQLVSLTVITVLAILKVEQLTFNLYLLFWFFLICFIEIDSKNA